MPVQTRPRPGGPRPTGAPRATGAARATGTPSDTGTPSVHGARAAIAAGTLRRDRWWVGPAVTVAVLTGFTAYGLWAALRNGGYYADPYLSPFYSPCLTDSCADDLTPHILGDVWPFSPAILILVFPLGFRLTCYYYRKAYYRSFWWAPPACAVPDARRRYTGETRFPLIAQNVHRYFFYIAVLFAGLLTFDAAHAFLPRGGAGFGFGIGTAVLLVNAVLIWLYTLSCHSCRHLCGGGLRRLSDAPVRFRIWRRLSVLNRHHMAFAWASLLWIMVADFYVWLVATGRLHDYHWGSP